MTHPRSTIHGRPGSTGLHLEIPPALIGRLGLRPGQSLEWTCDAQGRLGLARVESPDPPTPAPEGASPAAQKGARYCSDRCSGF